MALAVDLAGQHLRLADRELEAFAPHQLDEHRQLQLAAALHLPGVGRAVGSTRSETLPTSSRVEPFLDLAGGQPVPSVPASGLVLMPIVTDSEGSSTAVTGSGRGSSGSAIVSPIVTSGKAGERDDLARSRLLAGTRSSASVT